MGREKERSHAVLKPKVLDLNGLVSELEKMLRRLVGEEVELRVARASWAA